MQKKLYYDAPTLDRSLQLLEERFELATETYLRARSEGDESTIGHVPHFARHQWASFHAESIELRGTTTHAVDGHVEHELQVA